MRLQMLQYGRSRGAHAGINCRYSRIDALALPCVLHVQVTRSSPVKIVERHAAHLVDANRRVALERAQEGIIDHQAVEVFTETGLDKRFASEEHAKIGADE